MPDLNTKSIRNICLMGHGGCGKTTLAEAMLYAAGAIDRMGRIVDGNTVCDYGHEEVRRKYSISMSLANLVWKDIKINILDTPGYQDFAGEVAEGVRVADAAVILADGKAGLEVGTQLAWESADSVNIPRAIFINKCDDPEADFGRVFAELREAFGNALCPLFVPVKTASQTAFVSLLDRKAFVYDKDGKRSEIPMTYELASVISKYQDAFNEAVAESSEELLEKFFEGGEITREEAVEAIHNGIITGAIVPVYTGAATNMWGVYNLLDAVAESFPRPTAKKNEKYETGEDIPVEPDGETAVFVFKTVVDQFGKMSMFKVMNGTLTNDMTLENLSTGDGQKFAHIYTMQGKKQTEVTSLCCGDIGMATKLDIATCDTLGGKVEYAKIKFPEPYMCRGVTAAARGDEDKIYTGVSRLLSEDMTVRFENNSETKQMLLYGMSDIHMDIIRAKLSHRYGVKVEYTDPRIAYRETIRKSVQAEGKHKKQSGGSGQYGHVKITFSPGEADGLTFTQSVVGGSVPKTYFPAVEKGLLEAMTKGVLAGYPVVNLAADLYDGSYHDVDSNEISFKLAARLAYKDGLARANPVLLEPVGELKVSIPESMVGDIMSELNRRRGRVMGMNPDADRKGYTLVEAEAPQSEMMDYTVALRAMTQGRGRYTFRFVRYEEVPPMIAKKVIEEAAARSDDE